MKTIVSFIILLLATYTVSAQLTLENTYAYSSSVSELGGEEYYYLMDVPLSQCRIYNSSHELFVTINLPIPEGYYLSDIKYLSKNLFSNNNRIELLYIYEKYVETDGGYNMQYGLSVIDEDGSQLLVLPNGGWAEVKQVAGENKLLTYLYTYNPSGYYDVITNIYALGGTTTYTSYTDYKPGSVFPNPANEHLIVDISAKPELKACEFNLYTNAAQKLISLPIPPGGRSTIPIKGLSPGIYFYSLHHSGQMIESDKIIIR